VQPSTIGVSTSTAIATPEVSACARSAARLRAVFDEHFAFIWRSLRRLGLGADATDDAAQEVFMVAARRLDHIQLGSERAFLFGTALRIASDARRARMRHKEWNGDDSILDLVPALTPDPEMLTDQKRARELLDQLLERIPMELRAVFVLYEIEEMTMVEVAACLDLPSGTVASRLRRARERFQAMVKRLNMPTTP